jgi:hypothetical protein
VPNWNHLSVLLYLYFPNLCLLEGLVYFRTNYWSHHKIDWQIYVICVFVLLSDVKLTIPGGSL